MLGIETKKEPIKGEFAEKLREQIKKNKKTTKKKKMNRIFLGGTCAGTNWRDELIALMKNCNVEWFNPIVEDWTPECQANEENEKNNKCNVHLYVITPEMQGVYSIAEIVNSCWQAQLYGPKVDKVAFFTLGDFGKKMMHSLEATFCLCNQIAPFRCVCGAAKNVEEIFNTLKTTGYVE